MGRLNRREFLYTAGAVAAGLVAAGCGEGTKAPPKEPQSGPVAGRRRLPEGVEGRAIWSYLKSGEDAETEKRIAENLEQIAKANLNLVYLGADQPKTFKLAKELGLETHLNIHAIDYPQDKLEDRLLHKAPRGFLYATPCVNHKEVREHNINRILGSMEKYPDLDGVHIDWVGQEVEWHHGPGWVASCYCDECRSGFKSDHGVDPLDIARDGGRHRDMVEKWIRWRLDFVNAYVKELRAAIQKAKSDIAFSATSHQTMGLKDAVDGPYACSANFQEWGRWMAEGWMDFFAPMAYTCDNEGFRRHMEQVRKAEEQAAGKSYAYVGIGQSYLIDEKQLPEQIEIIRANGIGGFSIFASLPFADDEKNKWHVARMESPGEHWWKTLEEFLDKPARPPHAVSKEEA